MLLKNKKITITLMAVFLLFACSKSLYEPTAQNVSKNADIAMLKQGKELYMNKCGTCHVLFSPNKYNKTNWTKWVDRMAPKAKITEEERAKILAYVTKGE